MQCPSSFQISYPESFKMIDNLFADTVVKRHPEKLFRIGSSCFHPVMSADKIRKGNRVLFQNSNNSFSKNNQFLSPGLASSIRG
jgi:hypothetical protein